MFHVKHCGTFLIKTGFLHSQHKHTSELSDFLKSSNPQFTENENVKTNSNFQNDTFYR